MLLDGQRGIKQKQLTALETVLVILCTYCMMYHVQPHLGIMHLHM